VADGSNVAGIVAALIGTGVGAGTALGVEWVRGRAGDRASRRDALLAACSSFTATVARTRSLCYDLEEPDAKRRVRAQMEEARAECERLRLLIDASETQRAARMASGRYGTWLSVAAIHEPRSTRVRLRGVVCALSSRLSTSESVVRQAQADQRTSFKSLTERAVTKGSRNGALAATGQPATMADG
jgi:hypothetical protein